MINRENISKILSLWVDAQQISDDPSTKELIGNAFKENLSNIKLDSLSQNLSDIIFSMDYDELIKHINSLKLDIKDKTYIISVLNDLGGL